MNFSIEQWLRIWRELGVNQKASLIIASMVLVGATVAVGLWSQRPQMQLLYGNLDPSDLTEVLAVAREQGVECEITPGGNSVMAPSSEVHSLRMAMASKGIPSGGTVGYEIFDRGNFGISDFVQRTNYTRAIQGELSRTIAQLRGVRSARVMIVVPENRLLAEQNKAKPSASIFVDTGSHTLPEEAINSIRFLVANSVEGLSPQSVSVVDQMGNVLSERVGGQEGSGGSSCLRHRRDIEGYFTQKIEALLGRVLGPQSVVARVSVELDNESATRTSERFDPQGQVLRNQTINEEITNSSEVGKGSAADAQSGQAPTRNSQNTQKNKTLSYEINRETLETVKCAGSIKRLTAAVFIALRTEGEGKDATPKPRTPEELDSLKKMVVNTLGLSQEGEVSLSEAAFFTPPPPAPDGFMASTSPVWGFVDLGRSFLGILLAVVMFMLFLKMLKKHKPSGSLADLLDTPAKGGPGVGAGKQPTVELLNELIRQKPEAVGSALKSWTQEEP